jgi:hypothetical protein
MECQELYRQVNATLQRQTEAELRERARHPYEILPETSWRQFIQLWVFGYKTGLVPSDKQQTQKVRDLIKYYERIQRLENWRGTHG